MTLRDKGDGLHTIIPFEKVAESKDWQEDMPVFKIRK